MHIERYISTTQALWVAAHILSTILVILKLCGEIPDWPWGLVLIPFIFDLGLIIAVILGFCVLFFFSSLQHRDR